MTKLTQKNIIEIVHCFGFKCEAKLADQILKLWTTECDYYEGDVEIELEPIEYVEDLFDFLPLKFDKSNVLRFDLQALTNDIPYAIGNFHMLLNGRLPISILSDESCWCLDLTSPSDNIDYYDQFYDTLGCGIFTISEFLDLVESPRILKDDVNLYGDSLIFDMDMDVLSNIFEGIQYDELAEMNFIASRIDQKKYVIPLLIAYKLLENEDAINKLKKYPVPKAFEGLRVKILEWENQ